MLPPGGPAGVQRRPGGRDHLARDGKTRRRGHDRTTGRAALDLVSAWSAANRLGLGQVQLDPASHQITARPVLSQRLDGRAGLVTSAAAGGQTARLAALVEPGGESGLARHGKPGTVPQAGGDVFVHAQATGFRDRAPATAQTIEPGQGRIAERRWGTSDDPAVIASLHPRGAWRQRTRVTLVEAERPGGRW